jgi:hypothetical protein
MTDDEARARQFEARVRPATSPGARPVRTSDPSSPAPGPPDLDREVAVDDVPEVAPHDPLGEG